MAGFALRVSIKKDDPPPFTDDKGESIAYAIPGYHRGDQNHPDFNQYHAYHPMSDLLPVCCSPLADCLDSPAVHSYMLLLPFYHLRQLTTVAFAEILRAPDSPGMVRVYYEQIFVHRIHFGWNAIKRNTSPIQWVGLCNAMDKAATNSYLPEDSSNWLSDVARTRHHFWHTGIMSLWYSLPDEAQEWLINNGRSGLRHNPISARYEPIDEETFDLILNTLND